jgi:hypothetical protein
MRSNAIFAALALFAGFLVSFVAAAPSHASSRELLRRDVDSPSLSRRQLDDHFVRRDLELSRDEVITRRMIDDIIELSERQISTLEEASLQRRVDECTICLEKKRFPAVLITECENKSHEMCRACYDAHFSNTCPTCRSFMNPANYVERACKAATPPPSPRPASRGSNKGR